MRYSFLDLLTAPNGREPLCLVAATEEFDPIGPYGDKATRVSRADAVVGPLPEPVGDGGRLTELLSRHATPPDNPGRNGEITIKDAILVAPATGAWYPVIDGLPELLPSSLRDWRRDAEFFEQKISPRLPLELADALRRTVGVADVSTRPGDQNKACEISVLDRVDDVQAFLGPGFYSPFSPGVFEHPADLIRGFANSIPFLALQRGGYILDSGCGYSWTTEWLMKLGMNAVGVDINRNYMTVGRARMGSGSQPHLVVADVENLPLRQETFNAVLAFDAFHHIPNRAAAMRGYSRVLKTGGRVVLVEPGEDHEHASISQEVMQKYGILEIGMELPDVQTYIGQVEEFGPARQVFLVPHYSDDQREQVPASETRNRDFIGWGLFVIEKNRPSSLSAFR